MEQPLADVWIMRIYRAWLGPDQPLADRWIAYGTDRVWYSFPDRVNGWRERALERAFGWSLVQLSEGESTEILRRCGGTRPVGG